ncbi:MAG: tetratricopeptide repeat-containing serine protease family protein [Candidatus Poribacteria bacterium]|nr:tetratricopeptide repeat-containing serine protease family protein [Candidatus Poribacteria bacterium]
MKHISRFLFSFLTLGVILSCAQTPQRIELHPVYAVPRGTPEGPGKPLVTAEGLDTEKVKASTVRVVYGKGDSTMISSGFFVADDKIATNVHVVATADLASLHVRTDNGDCTIQGVTAFDTKNDLVILQISGTGVPFVIGNSDAVRHGETVFCTGYIGYPADRFNIMENTVLSGRLGSVWLRVTPDIFPGNSGGPVLNTMGEVIGINVAGSGPVGYIIESNALKGLLKQFGPAEPLAQWQKRDPVRAFTYLGEASDKFYAADYASAIGAVDKFIALNPTSPGIHMQYEIRGYAKALLGQAKFDKDAPGVAQRYYRAAIEDLDKAIGINPEDTSAYAKRGSAKTLFGHSEFIRDHVAEAQQYYRAAIEDFDKAIGIHPKFPSYAERGAVKVALGISETNQGHTTEAQQSYYAAIEDFDKATDYDRYDTYAYIIRGYTRICLADFESDKGNMEDARSLYEAAITDCDSAIKFDMENPYGYHTRGVAKAALDDYVQAIDDFDKTVSHKSDFARAYYNRAVAKMLLGEKREAKADFKKAKELDANIRK